MQPRHEPAARTTGAALTVNTPPLHVNAIARPLEQTIEAFAQLGKEALRPSVSSSARCVAMDQLDPEIVLQHSNLVAYGGRTSRDVLLPLSHAEGGGRQLEGA